ncbi:dihydrolipoyllysine-residue acetyltransferase [Pusillimonas noertemannii]|uniref:Acetyltransferase component of pyruvate dehydrogenase complex n=1 Tax=Pusillimonas noertemannii TaxID=305977 RepID=A0A2U1CJT9_9BURK|nr:dihydrolipoyllysine-residue acetyltransferase [Pusillimonas noertemannii]NYT69818.1 dihydrolipoyllysine-residue acetyltransferase [Pusillimonas noertemannii]PVY61258.1 pyruvate dehydrogenase E2 component (dihydrolipoamide acetyltransferase) [Pusillimonas noertemannii]TFL09119.1 dihydrolipoyllysine-residue acetyltransferase [Pusillimonas noertemannii]
MSTEIKIPDIGDFSEVDVIEVLVAEGDVIKAEQSLITVESDKASMEIPSPSAGTVKAVKVSVGDKVREGAVILEIEESGADKAEPPAAEKPASQAPAKAEKAGSTEKAAAAEPKPAPAASAGASAAGAGKPVQVLVPDIGDFKDVEVIELLVAEGDTVQAEQSLITVESDKASMEIPSSQAGVVKRIAVKVGDKVAQGSEILVLEPAAGDAAESPAPAPAAAPAAAHAADSAEPMEQQGEAASPATLARGAEGVMASQPVERTSPTQDYADDIPSNKLPYASPSVRKFARELGVDLNRVPGSGDKGRITFDDVRGFVKKTLASGAPQGAAAPAGGGLSVLDWPKVDFSKFGPTEAKPLSRIKKISGANLHRNWVMIPHVTNNDQADITELEALRVALNKENQKSGVKVTMLAFLIKAVVAALKKFPEFNASLDGDNLVYKQYYHVGFAADTPNGLVVPVIRDADKKGVLELATETSELAALAREGKLSPAQMQGGCFSISSLGGIGGTSFTPIINAPEVAILGVSRSSHMPVWDGQAFQPRLMLPLSLSYDHRVIDGAAAARFNAYLAALLADFRRIAL